MRFYVTNNQIESIEELTPLVVKLFSPILNRGRDPLPIIAEHPYGENEYKVGT